MTTLNSNTNTHSLNNPKATLLKTSLFADTVFTALCGLGLVIFNNAISNFLGWSISWIIPTLGVVFLLFAAYLFNTARQQTPNTLMVKTIIGVAVLWVIESCILLFLPASNPLALSTSGKWAVIILADIVFLFGLTQFIGLRRMKNMGN